VTFEAPKGTHDILPSEQPAWRHVLGAAMEVCRQYGYRPIQTPVFEETELFARTSGAGSDVVQKEMYTFDDRAGRSLTLRPEATAPIVRAYLEHGMHRDPQPAKLYTVGPMYRYSAPQRGRFREHWQMSVEAIGSGDPAVDAELVALYADLLARLGVTGYELQLNSIGDRDCRPAYIEQLSAWLVEHDDVLDGDARRKRTTSPLRVFDTKNPAVAEALEDAPKIGDALCDKCHAHFAEVRGYLDAYGVAYRIMPTLVRGLDYYTRTTFEFVDEAIGAQSAICGGGRYDHLAEELGGKPTPGIGFGAGIERLLVSLGDVAEDGSPGIDVFFVCAEGADRRATLAAMMELRRAGLACEADYAGRSHKGQLTQASRLGARRVVVVDGETDLTALIEELRP
jgi:histidyl-tRNA synthetase